MSEHTPGPWMATADRHSDIVVDQEGNEIALLGSNAKANARLIAAAPELLEALEALVLNIDAGGATLGAMHDARAAITKAGGNDE